MNVTMADDNPASLRMKVARLQRRAETAESEVERLRTELAAAQKERNVIAAQLMQTADELAEANEAIYARSAQVADLRQAEAEYASAYGRVLAEQCPTNEVHCTCVPYLRAEVKRLNDDLAMATTNWKRCIEERNEAWADNRRHKDAVIALTGKLEECEKWQHGPSNADGVTWEDGVK